MFSNIINTITGSHVHNKQELKIYGYTLFFEVTLHFTTRTYNSNNYAQLHVTNPKPNLKYIVNEYLIEEVQWICHLKIKCN